jgi:hypothetical protein
MTNKFTVYAVGLLLILVIIGTVIPYIIGVLIIMGVISTFFKERKTSYMAYSDYQAYLKSEKWYAIRLKVLSRDDYTCQHCHCKVTSYTANVHHKTYIRLGDEKLSDLITLCIPCHEKEHE